MIGLYLHIPFCSAICNYCNFNRGLFDEALKVRYVDALVLLADNKRGTHLCGWYDDEIVATEDGWRIAKRNFTMVYVTSDIGTPL